MFINKNDNNKPERLAYAVDKMILGQGILPTKEIFRVHQVRNMTDSMYLLRFDRNGMVFEAGQHITLGLFGDNQVREYSIYSTVHDPFLEVLVREVEDGLVSKRLHKLKPGDELNVDGPFGFFSIDENNRKKRKLLFVATGTGIAPFHSIIGSYPEIDYTLVHGVRFGREGIEKNTYKAENFTICSSRDTKGDFHGRVTQYLKMYEAGPDTLVYLCGNCEMIYEVYDLLTSSGFPSDQIRTEVYF